MYSTNHRIITTEPQNSNHEIIIILASLNREWKAKKNFLKQLDDNA